MSDLISLAEFDAIVDQIGSGVPNAEQYQRMSGLVLTFPEASKLAGMDPFEPDYKEAAMELYLSLRGRAEEGYLPSRDEAPAAQLPENIWTGLVPWSFRDAAMVSEHVLAWGHILAHLKLPAGGALLEYGPGSGQLLLMAARLGYRACGVDIDAVALEGIREQAAHLNLPVETERAEFGEGFGDQRFDAILFYEAFHHAFNFDELLVRLRDRLKPGGRVVLCGEPVVSDVTSGIPYPWGPRLDALSVFCMRRFGWMELGFIHNYLMKIACLKGWNPTFFPFSNCGRAAIYVLEPAARKPEEIPPVSPEAPRGPIPLEESSLEQIRLEQIESLRLELAAMRASTSWRITAPLRGAKGLLGRLPRPRH